MPLNLRPHEYRRRSNSNIATLIRNTPYIRMSLDGQPPIFIQDGRYYGAGGDEIKTPPDWLKGEIAKVSPEVRKSVGL